MLNILIVCFFFFLVTAQEIKEGIYSIYSLSGPVETSLVIQGALPIESGGGMNDGDRLITTGDPSAIENFEIRPADAESYYIFVKHSGKVLDEDMGYHYVQQWSAAGNLHQKWKIIRVTNEKCLIQGFESNRYLVAPLMTGEEVMTAEISDPGNPDNSFYWVLKYIPKDFCLTLILLSIGNVGDIDEVNEEIEIEIETSSNISTGNKQLNCGLFLFDFAKNKKDKDLMITIPCKENEYVQVRFFERDNCNDDTCLLPILCTPSANSEIKQITIKPDSTATSHTSCMSYSHQAQLCLSLGIDLGPSTKNLTTGADASGCYAYEWGKEECATEEKAETESEYQITYKVDKYPCDWQWRHLNISNNETCQFHQYNPSPSCSSTSNVIPKSISNHNLSGITILILTILGLAYV